MEKTVYRSYDDLPVTLTVSDVADVQGISLAGAYDLVREDDFPAFKVRNRILIPKAKFLAWIDRKSSEKAGI